MTNEVVERVRESNDIVEVIGERVALKKKGKNHVGLCPFHQEKTPSFTVSQEKQLFYCFGCQAGGDVFKFMELWENTGFKEALEILAQRAGIPIDQEGIGPGERRRQQEKERIYEVLNLAARYYHYLLMEPGGRGARDYCASRGISTDILRKFGLGYAPPGWQNLFDFLRARGYKEEILLKAGLVLPGKKKGGYYDRFRQRLIFPIWDNRGRVAAFGGRVLTDDSQPKYLNSPETSVYSKGKNLYGLHLARSSIRERGWVLVVEGYLDAIAVHQHGWDNVVASLGTSLTQEQARLLARHCQKVLIGYDADAAGQEATLRGFQLLRKAGCQVLVVPLPEGTDPDSFLRREGKEGFAHLLEKGQPLIEYRLENLGKQYGLDTAEGKVKVVNSLVPLLADTENQVEREVLVGKVAVALEISEASIWAEIRRYRRNQGSKSSLKGDRISTKRNNIEVDFHNQPNRLKPAGLRAQAILLAQCLADGEARKEITSSLTWEYFTPGANQELARVIWMYQGDEELEAAKIVGQLTDPEAKLLLSRLAVDENIDLASKDKVLRDCVAKVRKCRLQEEIEKVREQINSLDREGKKDVRENLLSRLMDLQTQLHKLS